MTKPTTNRTRLETLQALEECLSLAKELAQNVDLPGPTQVDIVQHISYVRDVVQEEVYSEQDTREYDWQVGFGEINFRSKD